ncbi:uncharacterized protein F4822DRAFT_434644 [Hypoxylon trugodes]|uniref:uncharacterized protein n=1 Tax=Hypoxylon trugodes TaxID=326681 RepID=UPI002191DCED|nr:uncharacterized protein F4822DRAFT_434644 [Hypoxylon trugodes]KAI1383532.1 hypothetical protein F4822DRAFT_434644 [Hypoxylon trugodes]
MSTINVLGIFSDDENFKFSRYTLHENGTLGITYRGEHRNVGIRRIKHDSIDFELMKKYHHNCNVKTTAIRNLRVIDCKGPLSQGSIQAPQNCRYAALSYVWGSNGPVSSSGAASGPIPPSKVVEDAISATLSMGIRYLWVDRHDQVSQMGNIYSNSEVTFIVAAGEDAEYGIPGIGTTPRRRQLQEIIGNTELLQCFPNSSYAIASSKWATRGWTFQEGVLSRRKIIFTDDGASYICQFFHNSEIMPKPLHWQQWPTEKMKGLMPRLDRIEKFAQDMLQNYSRRNLTHNSDAFDACLGILQEMANANIGQIWGVPIVYRYNRYYAIWLEWEHEQPVQRRPSFPSWSYLGWVGPIKWCAIPGFRTEKMAIGDTKTAFYNIHSLFDNRLKFLETRYSCLHLTGKVFEPVMMDTAWIEQDRSYRFKAYQTVENAYGERVFTRHLADGFYAHLKICNNIRMLIRAQLDVVGFVLNESETSGTEVLLLRARDNIYERVGFFSVSYWGFPTECKRRFHSY